MVFVWAPLPAGCLGEGAAKDLLPGVGYVQLARADIPAGNSCAAVS